MGEHIVVGIDVGTTKVVTLIGEVLVDGRVEVIGVGITPSRGLRKSIVVSVEAEGSYLHRSERFLLGLRVRALYISRLAHRIVSFQRRTQGTTDHRQRASQPS